MNESLINTNLLIVLLFVGTVVVSLLAFAKFYKKVDQGRALIINKYKAQSVTFSGGFVLPVFYRAEYMDISIKTIELDRLGKDGLICQDNIRADIKVTFFLRVNKTSDDVLKVAQSIGCERASDQPTIESLFVAKFSEALKTVGKRLNFEDLYTRRDAFRDQIIDVIGKDLNGFVLDDAAIDYLEQTPIESLDAQNILDAQGIRKITAMTAEQNIATNDLRQEERKAIKKKDVESQEAILELERQQADAEAKQAREIATVRARETAETAKVQAEELRRSELARIKSTEETDIASENKQREVEVAQKNRERVIGVETEKVEKDRALEAISREREVELQRIEKEKALEVQRKAIADVIAGRIAVEKTVAQEEEQIKDLREIAEAKRKKEAMVIRAEGEAQEKVVITIKEAEAQEVAARHEAKKKVTLAEADLESADRVARSKIRIAEGVQAEEAASGLAAAKVKEADAIASEKLGTAEARVKYATLEAEAKGAEAKGLAVVNIKEADAKVIDKLGASEASAIREKMQAEAIGLADKAVALSKLEGHAKDHEEFRLRLEKMSEIALSDIAMRQNVAEEQAKVMSGALSNAKINLVGGDGAFLDQFFKAVSLGHAVDGVADSSEIIGGLANEYKANGASLRDDLKEVLTQPGINTETLKNLSIAGLLRKVSSDMDGDGKVKLNTLIERAKELGFE